MDGSIARVGRMEERRICSAGAGSGLVQQPDVEIRDVSKYVTALYEMLPLHCVRTAPRHRLVDGLPRDPEESGE